MKKVQFVTGLHGNERVPVIALALLGIKQIIANPMAITINQRFIDNDMNRSFNRDGDTYEIRKAKELLEKINPDIPVVDLHTMSANSEPFSIIVDLEMLPFAQTLNLPIVYMKRNIKKGYSLINHCRGVSVECGQHDTSDALLTANLVAENALKGRKYDCPFFEVYDVITEPGHYVNFELTKNFYPVLAGEKAYDFFGLKARKIDL
jgi:hypothetical protein